MSARIHFARLISRRPLAQQTEELVFAHDEPELSFRPGQFISFNVGQDSDGNPLLRSYSIASPPQRRGELSLVVRLVPGGVASERFRRLEPGQGLQFTGPMGFFVNELAHSGDIVYVATGTGIAPIVPMVQEALERPAASDGDGKLHLYWGLRSEEDLFYRAELTALTARHPRLTCQIYLSQPQGFYRPRGRVSGPVLELLPSLRSPTFYLCGNGQMIEELKSGLVGRGVQRKRQIRTEAFFD